MTPDFTADCPALFDLSDRVKLHLTGTDSFRFLNGQVTNDVRKASADVAIEASILSAKGKLAAHVFISAGDAGGFFVDSDAELREALPARLERYIIADDVTIEDVTDRYSLFHVAGGAVPESATAARKVAAHRFGTRGFDLWVERTDGARLAAELSANVPILTGDQAEVLRIEMGIPRWGRELTDEIIPVEANLEDAAIDYAKGCYIGQEVISRMKMSGQRNKRLCGLVSVSGAPIQAGAQLFAADGSSREAGWVTSGIHSARLEKEIALGFVKRGFNDVGSQLISRAPNTGESAVAVVALPFT